MSCGARGAVAARLQLWDAGGAHSRSQRAGGASQQATQVQEEGPRSEAPARPPVLPHRRSDKTPAALFFRYNTQLGPPYQVIIDTNFINFSIRNKVRRTGRGGAGGAGGAGRGGAGGAGLKNKVLSSGSRPFVWPE